MAPRGLLSALFVGALPALVPIAWAGPAAAAWHEVPGGRYQEALPIGAGSTGFTRLDPAAIGLVFTNHLAEQSAANNRILENGSGVALGDVDGDGWCDVFLCRIEGENALFRNLGDGRFENITFAAGVGCDGQPSTGAVFADVDGDGDLDLLVNGIGVGTRLFLNDGHGKFTESTVGRLANRFGATSMALADMNGDGWLDLYVTNYRTDTYRDDPPGLRVEAKRNADGTIVVKPEGRFVALAPRDGRVELAEKGERDFLYLNQGHGKFAPVSWTGGAFLDEDGKPLKEAPTDWGLCVAFRDFTGDGHPDLYVCNDFAYWPDRIWINEGGDHFRAAARTRFRTQSLASMSVDIADIDRDGRDDLFVADMLSRRQDRRAWQRPNTLEGIVEWPKGDPLFRPEATRNTLHWARDDGSFAEIACLAGLAATEWTWSAAFVDVDLDGWEDLVVAGGNLHDVQHADVLAELARAHSPPSPESRLRDFARFPRLATGLLAFRNQHDLTFADAAKPWRLEHDGVLTSLAFADLDNDGDLDVVVNQLNGPAIVLRNDTPAPRVWVRCRGKAPNTRGVGARVRLLGGPVEQSQEIIAGGRYLASDESARAFAASPDRPMTLEVRWRNGQRTVVGDVRANRRYEVDEPDAAPPAAAIVPVATPLFADETARLAHAHRHDDFDDFARQSLLPRKLSTRGPALGWVDLDGDGREELFVGAGRGGTNAVRGFVAGGGIRSGGLEIGTAPPGRAVVAMLGVPKAGGTSLVLAHSNWEEADPNARPLSGSGIFDGIGEAIAGLNPGVVAAADLDGDGSPEVFVGNRCKPGRWPEAGPSHLLRRRDGHWQAGPPIDAGMVTGALFTDIDGDGHADLVTVSETGTPRVWHNRGGQLVASEIRGLSEWSGWWQSLAAGDFDGDGRMDLAAGNWGANWRIDTPDPSDPSVVLAYGDYAGPDRIEPLLASRDAASHVLAPWRERKVVAAALPWVAPAFPTHADYGGATLDAVLGPAAKTARRVSPRTDRSMVWLNRGDHFEPVVLPAAAQFAPVMALAAADFDGDGNEDLFLSQNFFATDAETSRQDAGTGTWLRGDGHGGFVAMGPRETGVRIDGEGRGVAMGDFDGDGAPDLAAAQFHGETRLLRNLRAAEFRTVRFDPTLPNGGVGTRVRMKRGSDWGAAREFRAGNGSGNQDAARLAFGGTGEPTALRITWADGREETRPWPGGREAVLSGKKPAP